MNKQPSQSDDYALLARQMAALAHPARLHILNWLARHDGCHCKDVVGALPLAQSTVSQHLKILAEAGLINATHKRPTSRYCINKSALENLTQATGGFVARCCEAQAAIPDCDNNEKNCE